MIDEKTVYYVASLAKVEIKPEEAKKFKEEFKKILEYFNILDEAKIELEPTFHVLPICNVFREDKPEQSFPRNEILKNAKHKEEGYFKGPKIVE